MSAFRPCAAPLEEGERPKTGAWWGLLERPSGRESPAGRRRGTWDGLNDGLALQRSRYPQADEESWNSKRLKCFVTPAEDPPGSRGNAPPQTWPQKLDQRGWIFFNLVPKRNFRPAGQTSKLCPTPGARPRNSSGARACPARRAPPSDALPAATARRLLPMRSLWRGHVSPTPLRGTEQDAPAPSHRPSAARAAPALRGSTGENASPTRSRSRCWTSESVAPSGAAVT